MSIIEKVMQPLLNARYETGLAEGRNEGLAEGLIEGLAEGRTEERSEWRDWLNRKTRAEIDGQPFDEPAPDEKR